MKITHASSLTNVQLTAELSRIAHAERQATVALIVHLAEFDARRLHLGAGFTSLYDYCMRVLHFTEDVACNRIAAARVARRYPVALDTAASRAAARAGAVRDPLHRQRREPGKAAPCPGHAQPRGPQRRPGPGLRPRGDLARRGPGPEAIRGDRPPAEEPGPERGFRPHSGGGAAGRLRPRPRPLSLRVP